MGVIKHRDFYNLVSKNIRIALNIIKVLVKRLSVTDHEIKNLVFKPALYRVAETLLFLAGEKNYVNIRIKELSEMVGTNRETVSRIITLLSNLKYISREKRNIIEIINKDKLKLLCDSK